MLAKMRRLLINIVVATTIAGLVITPHATFADGSTGVVRFLDLNFTQNEFRSLSDREIRALSRNDEYYDNFTIAGFSRGFAKTVLTMFIMQRGRARRLLRDMSRLTDRADRQRRLREEIEWVNDLKIRINDGLARLAQKPDNAINRAIIQREESQFENLERYKRALQAWLNSPDQGMR